MTISVHPHLAAGLAAFSTAAVLLSSAQPLPTEVGIALERPTSNLAVELAAAIDPITPWTETLTNTWTNLKGLTALYLQQPFPLLTTIAKNQLTYLQELPDIGLIANQMWGNVQTFFTAPYVPTPDNISDALITTIGGLPISQQTVYALLQTMLGNGEDLQPLVNAGASRISAELQPLIEFTATPVSGELIGLLGPIISPVVQLTQSFTAIGDYFQTGDVAAALNELVNIPAHLTNAALNGGTYLDLTGVVRAAGFALPPEVKSVGFNLGGLLNVVPVAYEPPTVPTSDIQPYSGGLAFDALATEVESPTYTFQDPGWPVGAIGSVIGLGQALGDAMLVTPPTEMPVEVPAAAAVKAPPAETAAQPPADVPAALDGTDEASATTRDRSAAAVPVSENDDAPGRQSTGHRGERHGPDRRATRTEQ